MTKTFCARCFKKSTPSHPCTGGPRCTGDCKPSGKTTKTEKYAGGKWFVYTTGDYPRRIGHIVGGNRRYAAEMGPDGSLGYFETLKGAAAAIEARNAITPCGFCGEKDTTPGRHGVGRGQCAPL